MYVGHIIEGFNEDCFNLSGLNGGCTIYVGNTVFYCTRDAENHQIKTIHSPAATSISSMCYRVCLVGSKVRGREGAAMIKKSGGIRPDLACSRRIAARVAAWSHRHQDPQNSPCERSEQREHMYTTF